MDGGVEDVLLRKTDGWLSECRVACQAKDARVCSGQTRWRDRYSHDDEAHRWRHAHPQVHPCHHQLSTTFNLQINRVRSQNFSSQKSGKSRRRWGSWIAFGHKELWMTWLRVVLVCLLMVKCCCGLELNTFFYKAGLRKSLWANRSIQSRRGRKSLQVCVPVTLAVTWNNLIT